MLLVVNNALQGILSSFFFKYADTILKKYSSTVATIVTGLMSAALFGHTLTLNFVIGVTIVFISMHQFFSQGASPRRAHALLGAACTLCGFQAHCRSAFQAAPVLCSVAENCGDLLFCSRQYLHGKHI